MNKVLIASCSTLDVAVGKTSMMEKFLRDDFSGVTSTTIRYDEEEQVDRKIGKKVGEVLRRGGVDSVNNGRLSEEECLMLLFFYAFIYFK